MVYNYNGREYPILGDLLHELREKHGVEFDQELRKRAMLKSMRDDLGIITNMLEVNQRLIELYIEHESRKPRYFFPI